MKHLIKNFKTVALSLLILSFFSCDDDDAILPVVEAGFTYTTNSTIGLVSIGFLNTSALADSYTWDFGDGTTSTEINPSKVYTTSGIYTVVLTAKNVAGASSTFEDILTITVPEPLRMIVEDFEGTPPTFTVFGNIAATEVIANPDATGENTTANVAQLTKTAGSEVWAGTFFETTPALDFNTFSKLSVKTWSPISGALVKLKLENQDSSITHEIDINNTVANAWEELVYDFSGAPTADYVRIVIFFDFGNAGDGSLYYYDEVTLVE